MLTSLNSLCLPFDKIKYCPFYLKTKCNLLNPLWTVQCDDGKCATSINQCPSKKVCPYGYVLCPNLTCSKSYGECQYPSFPCKDNEITCNDLSCQTDQRNCPSLITCAIPGYVSCPDGSCKKSFLECKALINCPIQTPYLCNNNSCVKDLNNCPKSISCGYGKSLCEGTHSCSDQC